MRIMGLSPPDVHISGVGIGMVVVRTERDAMERKKPPVRKTKQKAPLPGIKLEGEYYDDFWDLRNSCRVPHARIEAKRRGGTGYQIQSTGPKGNPIYKLITKEKWESLK